jgi:hypothetical protein
MLIETRNSETPDPAAGTGLTGPVVAASTRKKLAPRSLAARCSARAGVAALEFALVTPILVWLFIGLIDFSLAYHDELQLSSGVAAAAEFGYAQAQITNEPVNTLEDTVNTFLQNLLSLDLNNASSTNVTVLFNNTFHPGGTVSGALCFCLSSGSGYSYMACGSGTCPDGSTPGAWLSIQAQTTFTPYFPGDAPFFSSPLVQMVTVRVK